ncbi:MULTISPECIES: response regulator transcription factor [unclassified Rhizobium]|uniref:response regulator transcription factor n=1 Tax=unclassified Rhizobium TaxID=2613769 RepID=UPI00216774F3|nr:MULTISPECIES: response regulator [unclassified Rhizobium]MCS3742085.1 FixJ family two-component response regulator [Rhizobium sp. BK661]MCS4093995.1 FixJ family two-component response regulator [Rhizobium sp. BK176]
MGKKSRTVAVVDDDGSLRRSVARLVNAYGFSAVEYASAEAFLNRDSEAAIDCLVLDIDLEGITGLELQSKLNMAGSTLPVIFITALEDELLKKAAERTRCIAYLQKPFAGAALIAAINKALQS